MKIPDHLQPKQIMFLSADIVGSTGLKQQVRATGAGAIPDGQRWFFTIQGFYVAAVKSFFARWDEAFEAAGKTAKQTMGDKPIVWKTIGDEILFRKHVSDHRQVGATLQHWIDAMVEVRAFLKAHGSPDLDVKCTAWIGEFPTQNKVVFGPDADRVQALIPHILEPVGALMADYEKSPVPSGLRVDFIGPAIDVGFRLAKLATARKFVLSIDVTYLLMHSPNQLALPNLHYDGLTYMKGVVGGLAYPVFWLDLSPEESFDREEDKILSRKECTVRETKAFCDAFYNERSNFVDRPFIDTDSVAKLRQRPTWYGESHQVVVEAYS